MERNTRQRAAIMTAFERNDAPLSPPELLKAARPFAPGMGIATVYRAIKALVEEGFLAPVRLPGAADRYEPAKKEHHHHFECRTCGKVFELEGCLKNLGRLLPRGMKLEGHELILYGRCRACAG